METHPEPERLLMMRRKYRGVSGIKRGVSIVRTVINFVVMMIESLTWVK